MQARGLIDVKGGIWDGLTLARLDTFKRTGFPSIDLFAEFVPTPLSLAMRIACAGALAFLFMWLFKLPILSDNPKDSSIQMTRFSSKPLPKDWSTLPGSETILFSSDVAVSQRSTIKAKVLVFRDLAALQRFWRLGLSRRKPDEGSYAVVNDVSSTITYLAPKGNAKREDVWEVDPTYFCVMGFILGNLSMECITHESVHAAYAYARRVAGRKTWPDKEDPEEHVCYPAGRIAAAINKIFQRHGIYDRQLTSAWPEAPKNPRNTIKTPKHIKRSAAASRSSRTGHESEIQLLRAKLEEKRRADEIKYQGMKMLLEAGISTSNCFFMPKNEVFDFGSMSPMSRATCAKLRADIEAIKFPYSVQFSDSDEIPCRK